MWSDHILFVVRPLLKKNPFQVFNCRSEERSDESHIVCIGDRAPDISEKVIAEAVRSIPRTLLSRICAVLYSVWLLLVARWARRACSSFAAMIFRIFLDQRNTTSIVSSMKMYRWRWRACVKFGEEKEESYLVTKISGRLIYHGPNELFAWCVRS